MLQGSFAESSLSTPAGIEASLPVLEVRAQPIVPLSRFITFSIWIDSKQIKFIINRVEFRQQRKFLVFRKKHFQLIVTRFQRFIAFHGLICVVAAKERLYGDLSFLAFFPLHTCSIADF